jgi:hypothetical protein
MKFNVVLPIIALILLYIVFIMINYLVKERYVIECFNSQTSHTVDLPLNSTYSCKNFCGPNSRCAISGQQCFTDIDCPGCQPLSPPLPKTKDIIPGNNDAGKLTSGVTPTYSPLTSGYGTRERIVTKDLYAKPSQANFGVDTWGNSFNEGQKLFNKRYKPNQLVNMPNYPQMYSITGEFIGDGPLPSNY